MGAPEAGGHWADSPPSQSSVGERRISVSRAVVRWEVGPRAGSGRASWAHLVHDLGEGLLQFAMHGSQLLVVSVGFQDGDKGLVDLVHCLVEPALVVGAHQDSQHPP